MWNAKRKGRPWSLCVLATDISKRGRGIRLGLGKNMQHSLEVVGTISQVTFITSYRIMMREREIKIGGREREKHTETERQRDIERLRETEIFLQLPETLVCQCSYLLFSFWS